MDSDDFNFIIYTKTKIMWDILCSISMGISSVAIIFIILYVWNNEKK